MSNPIPSEELQILDMMQLAIASLLADVQDALRTGDYTPAIVERFRTRYAALEEQLATVRRFVRYSEIIEEADLGGAS